MEELAGATPHRYLFFSLNEMSKITERENHFRVFKESIFKHQSQIFNGALIRNQFLEFRLII